MLFCLRCKRAFKPYGNIEMQYQRYCVRCAIENIIRWVFGEEDDTSKPELN